MRTTGLTVGAGLVLVILSACSPDPEGSEVHLLAGGGDQDDGTGSDAALPPSIYRLTSDGQGTLWGIAASDTVVEVSSDGAVRSTQVQRDGGGMLAEIAATPDGTVFLLPDQVGQDGAEAVVFEFADGELLPAVGLPAPASDDPGPVSPDGTPAAGAELGYVADIAVDEDGRLLLLEQAGPNGTDTGFLVRRVEDDGSLTTVAGQPSAEADGSISEAEAAEASFPAEGTDAGSLLIYGDTRLEAGPGEQVVLQTTQSVLTVEDGSVRTVLGAQGGGELPPAPDDGPLSASTDALAIDYQPGLPQLTLAVNAAGGILASTDSFTGYDEDAYRWQVDGGSDAAQAIADANGGDAGTSHPTIYVTPDGEAMTASVTGGPAAWLDDDTVAVVASDAETGGSIIVTIDLPD